MLQSGQKDATNSLWTTLGGESSSGEEDAQIVFQRVINESLSLDLILKNIYPIYDYFHDEREKTNFVFYAEVKDCQEFDSIAGNTLSWVNFDETSKFLFAAHSKQDVIVGERVINAKLRADEASKEKAASI